MKRKLLIIFLIIILFLLDVPIGRMATTYYVSTSGSGTTCSFVSPCALQYALSTLSVTSDDTILLRGGTYTGRFASTLTGTANHNITVKSYCTVLSNGCYNPANVSEWAKLDGYITTTLATTINNTDTTIVLTDASKFIDGASTDIEVTIDNEVILLRNKSGNTFTNCLRGRGGGQSASSHTSSTTVFVAGQQVLLVQAGEYVTFRDFEILDSNPIRTYSDILLDPQYRRPEGIYIDTPNISAINLVIHNCREGVGFWDNGYEGLIYGNVLYNNGFVDTVRGHGHGIYTQNTNIAGKQIKETILFNNYATGMKMYGVLGTANHYLVEGVISWNNGSPATYSGNPAGLGTDTRESNLFAGTESVPMNDITVQQCYAYHPTNILLGSMNIGYDTTGSTNGIWQDNYIINGLRGIGIVGWNSLIFRRNYVYSVNTTGNRNNNELIHLSPRGGSLGGYDFNTNEYHDNTQANNGCPGIAGNNRIAFYDDDNNNSNCNPGVTGPLDYNSAGGWTSLVGESGSTYAGGVPSVNIISIRPNIYDSNRWNIIIINWTGATSTNINMSSYMTSGDHYAIHVAEEGTFPVGTPSVTGTFGGTNISFTLNGAIVATPIGSSFTPATVRPTFAIFELTRTSNAVATRCNWNTSPACN